MQVELFRGSPAQLKAKLEAIIATPRTIHSVTKLVAGHYLILHTP